MNEPAGAHPHGSVLGAGAAPESALEDLVTEAERRAAQLAQEAAAALTGLGDAAGSFHVGGVRLYRGARAGTVGGDRHAGYAGRGPWSGSWAQLRRSQQAG
jgi:hypothetical protein